MTSYEEFLAKFTFVPDRAFKVGVERECFLRNAATSELQAEAEQVHALMQQTLYAKYFSPELSATQYEYKTDPLSVSEVGQQLVLLEAELQQQLASIGLYGDFTEVAEATMPLDVYPDPRYLDIARTISKQTLIAASRVAGTHVHVGMPDLETAIKVYNHVRSEVFSLNELGNHSGGERLRLYRTMAPFLDPKQVEGSWGLYELSRQKGFVDNPRNWWSMIRITIHGTIEFRSFGSVRSIDQIVVWAEICQHLCRYADRVIRGDVVHAWGF